MKDAGYQYVVIDDCWQIDRDSLGNVIADPKRFPSGMKALADYVHSKGLKFGIYSCAGRKTCENRPGGRGYEFQDARTYAEWGVDYLKYDWCNSDGQNAAESYTLMRDALYKAGRPIVFSICEWGSTKPWEWAKEVGHLWRTTGDIINCFDCKEHWGGNGVLQIIDLQVDIIKANGPDHWNDPDMLEIGNGVLTPGENRAHFSMWAMLSAPLMAGNDLRKMTKETTDILCNKEVIAIDQDSLGKAATKWRDYGDFEIWIKRLQHDNFAICFLNRGKDAVNINSYFKITIDALRLDNSYTVRDLWQHKDFGNAKSEISGTVPPHDVVMVTLTKNKN